jgi:tetratricopeptide (TPR) repeat protein
VNNKDKYGYRAYISYSHRNEGWAKWLHHALESYRVPRKLIGTATARGKVPARLRPVFRDRDDLSSASDLGLTVKQALVDSENMIVVCSPDSAASRWVNEEIRQFAALGRQKRIFCIIVDGQPPGPGQPATCFPEALAEVGLEEPLAADVRKWADGKNLSKLKLIAGMLGLPLDQLRQRDLQKRQKLWALAALASVVIAAVVIAAVESRIAAQQRRVSGESLVSYKLNELRTMLDNGINPEDPTQADTWDEQEAQALITAAENENQPLDKQAAELRKQGNALYKRGELQEALARFQQSWLLFAENYRRAPGNLQAFFELGQADFYVGQTYMDLGEMDKAEEAFMLYAEITRRLIQQQPENAEWVLEMAYALNNLGGLEHYSVDGDPQRALQFMQSALEYNQIALVLDPKNDYYRSELGQSHAFLADAQRGVCDLDGALHSRLQNVSLERQMFAGDPEAEERIKRLAWALNGLSVVQGEMGHVKEAKDNLEESISLTEKIDDRDPADSNIARLIMTMKQRLAILDTASGNTGQALQISGELYEQWQRNFDDAAEEDLGVNEGYVSYLTDRAWIAMSVGNTGMAAQSLADAMTRAVDSLKKFPGNRGMGNSLMLAAFRYWEINQALPGESILMNLPYYYSNSGQIQACTDASMAARKAIMLGDMDRAKDLTEYLTSNGYAETTFMRACKAHAFCNGQ